MQRAKACAPSSPLQMATQSSSAHLCAAGTLTPARTSRPMSQTPWRGCGTSARRHQTLPEAVCAKAENVWFGGDLASSLGASAIRQARRPQMWRVSVGGSTLCSGPPQHQFSRPPCSQSVHRGFTVLQGLWVNTGGSCNNIISELNTGQQTLGFCLRLAERHASRTLHSDSICEAAGSTAPPWPAGYESG